jgi:hypothetical protein
VQRIVDKNHRWQDQSKRNKVSSGGEAFLIVGSHSKFLKEGGPSDLLVDKKNAEEEDRSQASDLSARIDHRWIMKNLHVH